MKLNSPKYFSELLSAAHPWSLVLGGLMYTLGAGIQIYLGKGFDWAVFFIGLASVVLLQLSSYFLKSYYDRPVPLNSPLKRDQKRDDPEHTLDRRVFLQIAITTLTIWAVLTFLLYTRHVFHLPAIFILLIAFLLAYAYAVPPFRLVYSGYGELSDAILIANLSPALGLLLQAGELHRLLILLTFPVTIMYLAGELSISLHTFASDTKNLRKTLLIRLGWQRGMTLHNLLILFAYLLIAFALLIGLPLNLVGPGLLTLPLGIFQIYQMRQISGGAKPHWKLLIFIAWVIPLLTTYLFTFALWTR